MLKNIQSAQERWGGASDMIDRWLKERQELIINYCNLSEEPGCSDAGQKLQRTCEILVDYVSAGHFEIYDKLIKEGRETSDAEALQKARTLFDTIDNTTEFILDFNDKYLETDDLETISEDLSKLGEVMATRFDAEDQMIDTLYVANQQTVN